MYKKFKIGTVIFIVLPAALLIGQQQAPQFRAGARLVEVTVAALDKKNAPVADLVQSDFSIDDNGKARPVAFFHYDGEVAKSPAPADTAPGTFYNRAVGGADTHSSTTALVLDTLNTPQEQNTTVLTQMTRYLKALNPESRLAIYLMGWDLKLLYDFTGNSEVVRSRLETLTKQSPLPQVIDSIRSTIEADEFLKLFEGMDIYPVVERALQAKLEADQTANAALMRNRLDLSLAAMESLGMRLGGIPGRKNLVWMTSGFSMVNITGTMGTGQSGNIENFTEKVRRAAQHLAQNGIVLYIVDPGGLKMPAQSSAEQSSQPSIVRGGGASGKRGNFDSLADTQDMGNDSRGAMTLLASVTGGRYMYGTNDLTVGFRQTISDIRGSYTIGFYAPENADNKWHKLKVKVNRPGVTVMHRQGYLAESVPAKPLEWDQVTWRTAFTNPAGSSVVAMRARCVRTPLGDLSLTLTIDPASLSFRPDGQNLTADVQVSLWNGRANSPIVTLKPSTATAQWEQFRTQGVVYNQDFKQPQGSTVIRAVARDMHTGQYGTVDIPLNKVPPASR